jgi:hypothetical protein
MHLVDQLDFTAVHAQESSAGWRFRRHENSTSLRYIRYLADSLNVSRTTYSELALYYKVPFKVQNVPITLWLRERRTVRFACNDVFGQKPKYPSASTNIVLGPCPQGLAYPHGSPSMLVAVTLELRAVAEWKLLSLRLIRRAPARPYP